MACIIINIPEQIISNRERKLELLNALVDHFKITLFDFNPISDHEIRFSRGEETVYFGKSHEMDNEKLKNEMQVFAYNWAKNK
jgi:hypothetical protein